jgi:Protein of unknown function (DUF3047)
MHRALVPLVVALLVLSAGGHPASDAADGECLVVEDFKAATAGQFPAGWKARTDEGTSIYTVHDEDGGRFLRATSKGQGIQAGKQFAWDLATYPVLAWSWRPLEFPQGADERKSATNDSVLSVYAVFPAGRFSTPKSVKYIWSAVVPKGTRVTSSAGRTQGVILESGSQRSGQWVEERVNVLADVKRYHGDKVLKPEGIAVLTDSDDTKSTAVGDYANFRLCRA